MNRSNIAHALDAGLRFGFIRASLCIRGTISPIQDWRVDIGGGSYGLVECDEGTSQVYVGKPVSPPVATAEFLFFGSLVVMSLTRAVGRFKESFDSNA